MNDETRDQELKERLEELAGKAGVDLTEPPAQLPHRQAGRPVQRNQQASPTSAMMFGGWPTVAGLIDPRVFCRPPRGSNLSLLPFHGGTAAIKGGMTWEVWCVTVCQCEAHTAQRETMAGERRTMIQDEETGT